MAGPSENPPTVAHYLNEVVRRERAEWVLRQRKAENAPTVHRRLIDFIQQDQTAQEELKAQQEALSLRRGRAHAQKRGVAQTASSPLQEALRKLAPHPQASPDNLPFLVTPPYPLSWSQGDNSFTASADPTTGALSANSLGNTGNWAGIAFVYEAPANGLLFLTGISPIRYNWDCGPGLFSTETCNGFLGWYVWDVTTATVVLDRRNYLWNASASGFDSISGDTGGNFLEFGLSWPLPVQARHLYEVWLWCGTQTNEAASQLWVDVDFIQVFPILG